MHGIVTQYKKRPDFLDFMDDLIAELPESREYRVVLDNYCIHECCDKWLAQHPTVKFHFRLTSASWLNMIKIWFCILSRKILRDLSFLSGEDLREAIECFIAAYNKNDAHPFGRRKWQVKGAQII